MDINTIYQQVFMQIPESRKADVSQVLNMFCLEHNIKGNIGYVSIDLSTATIDIITVSDAVQISNIYTISYTDVWDNDVNALTLSSGYSNIKQVVYDSQVLTPISFAELGYYKGKGYFIGDESKIYFNFTVDRDKELFLECANLDNTIASYGNNWLGICVRYCLKELYSKPKYLNKDLYQINAMEYERLKRIVHRTYKGKPYLNCMESEL